MMDDDDETRPAFEIHAAYSRDNKVESALCHHFSLCKKDNVSAIISHRSNLALDRKNGRIHSLVQVAGAVHCVSLALC